MNLLDYGLRWGRTFLKFSLSLLLGGTMTVMLLYLMQYLIDSGNRTLNAEASVSLVDFVRIQEHTDLQTRTRKVKPPELPDDPPPPIRNQDFTSEVDPAGWVLEQKLDVDATPDFDHGGFISDGEYLPIVKVQPAYPRTALAREIVGWVLVRFTVNEQGLVENPEVVANCAVPLKNMEADDCYDQPNRIFDNAALKAASRFKYKPRVINGAPVATTGVRNLITFEISG